MDEKVKKKRGNSRYFFFFLVIVVFLSLFTIGCYHLLCRWDWLTVRKIDIKGNEQLSNEAIMQITKDYYNRNLLEISSTDIRNRLNKIKRIEKISIIRLFPSTLRIKIKERKGFLYLKTKDGDLVPIDNEGIIIENAVNQSIEDLPIVHTDYSTKQMLVGKKVSDNYVQKIIALQKKIIEDKPEFLKSISEYFQKDGLIYFVDASYGTKVIMGENDIATQLKRYQFVLDNGSFDKRSTVDLRFKDQVVVKPEVR